MSLLYKNYARSEVIYLLIRFNKAMPFLWNKEYWEKSCKWAKDLDHTERERWHSEMLVGKSMIPLSLKQPNLFLTTPPF